MLHVSGGHLKPRSYSGKVKALLYFHSLKASAGSSKETV
jgi:hypothetical protein